MRKLLVLVIILMTMPSFGSRLLEVEDYYQHKTSEFIKSRYPNRAFTVNIVVQAEEKPDLRQPASNRAGENINLPYMSKINPQDVGFWERKDLSLGTMISYLKGIFVNVELEGELTDLEKDSFQKDLFRYLKLSEIYDRIEIKSGLWSQTHFWEDIKGHMLIALGSILSLGFILFAIFHLGVGRLVNGLAKPLSEIGKSAESVANSSGIAPSGVKSIQGQSRSRLEGDYLGEDKVRWIESEMSELMDFFKKPSAQLLHLLEKKGQENPYAVGALLSYLDTQTLQGLLLWSQGSWWRVAVTQPSQLTIESMDVLSEIIHLSRRLDLLKEGVDESQRELELALTRLDKKDFGTLLKGYEFSKAEPILNLLPSDLKMTVGKYLYPGEWANLLKENKKEVSAGVGQSIKKKSLEVVPLKSMEQIGEYFKDADLLKVLDEANTKDEREIYRTIDKDSWIANNRKTFYSVFDSKDEVLQTLAFTVPLETWAMAISHCDREECDVLFKHFNTRQKFILRNFKESFRKQAVSVSEIAKAKRYIVTAFESIHEQAQGVEEGTIDVQAS